ncbi:MAG: hypothetical protein KDH15_17430 [Rhodocyclaceae bacterium]|nr:hypothetical protein [Rhodocyclaceae bacterium]
MNAQQIQWVQSSFQTLAADPDGVARAFYAQLFRIAPELRPMFKPEMGEQRARLMQVLAAAVRGLDDLDRLLPTLHALGRRHAGYGVEPRHYAVVGRALVDTLRVGLGAAFTADVEAAWCAAYAALAEAMISGSAATAAAV